jgi:iron complex transport system substrate-binding protein
MRQYQKLWLGILLISVLGCSSSSQTPIANQNTNNSPSAANLPATDKRPAAKRVVALLPLAADLVARLDSTKLVGVSSGEYIEKNAKFKDLPRVGDRSGINLEKVIALKPDLVIGSDVFQAQALEKVKQTGVETLIVRTSNWQDLETITQTIADRLGADATPILEQYRRTLEGVKPNGKSVLVVAGMQPTSSPNRQSWAGDLLEKFGYRNMVAELPSNGRMKGYLTLSQEKILEMNPDKIFIIEGGGVRQKPEEIKALPFWKDLKAFQNNQVYIFHHDGLISPTSVDTVEAVAKQLREAAQP